MLYCHITQGSVTVITMFELDTNLNTQCVIAADTLGWWVMLGTLQILDLEDYIPTLAGKLKINMTEAKVGLKSCRFY